MSNCVGTKVGFFAAGVGLGAAIAMLLTPKSGRQARKLIAKKAGEGRDYVSAKSRELIDSAGERLADTLETGKSVAKSTFLRQ